MHKQNQMPIQIKIQKVKQQKKKNSLETQWTIPPYAKTSSQINNETVTVFRSENLEALIDDSPIAKTRQEKTIQSRRKKTKP